MLRQESAARMNVPSFIYISSATDLELGKHISAAANRSPSFMRRTCIYLEDDEDTSRSNLGDHSHRFHDLQLELGRRGHGRFSVSRRLPTRQKRSVSDTSAKPSRSEALGLQHRFLTRDSISTHKDTTSSQQKSSPPRLPVRIESFSTSKVGTFTIP